MRFTEELRAWAREHQVLVGGLGLEKVADRIDGRWEQEEADFDLMTNKIAAQATCLVEVGEALGVSADQPDSEFYWELAEAARGCIQLPKDADGETIRIGELVDEMLPFGGYAAPAPVDTMELSRGASGYGWMVKLDAENRSFISPKLLRHHHEPTVEDVLREFVDEFNRDDTELCDGEIIERFAAKLRLAGDGK